MLSTLPTGGPWTRRVQQTLISNSHPIKNKSLFSLAKYRCCRRREMRSQSAALCDRDSGLEETVERIHSSPFKLVLYVTGGAAQVSEQHKGETRDSWAKALGLFTTTPCFKCSLHSHNIFVGPLMAPVCSWSFSYSDRVSYTLLFFKPYTIAWPFPCLLRICCHS